MKIPFIDLVAENMDSLNSVKVAINNVIESGKYILGKELDLFEKNTQKFTGVDYCVGVANGTDALVLAMQRYNLGEGDEVVTVANSYLATVSSIILTGATPVLCDVDKNNGLMSYDSLKNSITNKTKAVIVVHLGGYLAEIKKISDFCEDNNLVLIEDCAQSFGTFDENNKHVGSFGDMGVFSAHPLKNLASMGDAGFVLTNHSENNEWLRKARSHGHTNRDNIEFASMNSRMDEIQAAILNVKLKYVNKSIAERRRKVLEYYNAISGKIIFPSKDDIMISSHHLLIVCIDERDKFISLMEKKYGIEIKIHYPLPYHKLAQQSTIKIYDNLLNTDYRADRIISLPIGKHITTNTIDTVNKELMGFI